MTRETQGASLVRQVALCAPAVRMVVLQLFAEGPEELAAGDWRGQVYPVVAIRSELTDYFLAWIGPSGRLPVGATAAEMADLGWRYSSTSTRDVPLVVADDSEGLCGVEDIEFEEAVHCLVVCDWPEAEDDGRFRSRFERLANRLAFRFEMAAKRSETPK